MRIIADLHIHSRYSRACSKQITIPNLEKFARIKGLGLLGTGDFTHPAWIKDIGEHLKDDGTGVLKTASGYPFLLTSEVSLIYTAAGRGRKVHLVLFSPDMETVGKITEYLKKRGRVDYDGRPIFGIPCPDFVESVKGIDERVEIVPAHAWTPYFGLFGDKSGFDRIEDCFKDQTRHIFGLETGLSSNPGMNWRLSALDRYSLLSFSDSHSHWPWRLGREATVFDLKDLTYDNLIRAIRTKRGLAETIEFFPEEGKYHFDGHRDCNVRMAPSESIKKRDICPVCGRLLTIGVLHRVEELADRPEGSRPEGAVPYKSLIPLSEIIAMVLGVEQPFSNKVWAVYDRLIKGFGNEFEVLLNAPEAALKEAAGENVADGIIRVREGRVEFRPGYDGVYGIPSVGEKAREAAKESAAPEKGTGPGAFRENKKQKNLMDF